LLATDSSSQGAERGDTSVDATYSTYTYQAACGIAGSILATFLVEWGKGGRKFAGAFFMVGAGVRALPYYPCYV
jgi:hypothetical protein